MATQFTLLARGANLDFNPWKPPNRRPDHKQVSSIRGSIGGGASGGRRRVEISPPGLGSFKPPNLGYGSSRARDEQSRKSEEVVESMMESLRNGMGSWHTRAKTIWELQQMGFTAEQLYDVALVTAHLQTAMVVASKVYDSLVLAQASSELLSALESNETHVCSLYELRILSSKQRKAAAEYVVEKGLDTKGAEELARAIKQHERRAELREGFSPLPGDCLALMHYRAAKESSQADEKQSLAQRALEFAVSEAAVEKISKLLQNV
ncbi:rubisco accumulation factor 1.1, chloroplastic [Selaginella moellendorffii]|uniref:rubisco accumulation factor 1.1, chloroplastic n=1 Tax=Selaginella moellendorffii TaxID=88036 RepID=UPI000D1CB2A0|nr:rubisco accumulation factor 1.1, chloroplastic [Selaginella moellendorffii]|eukprot:XP_024533154.1 rubisco accumulation factor 1.1, chloroplastic [Selaginella moellendorffii]